MNKRKTLGVLFLLGILLAIFFIFFVRKSASSDDIIIINNKIISVETADTVAKRAQGLSGRQSLSADQGMLFVFDSQTTPSFWMKDMKFPLDIIWLQDQTVVDLTENLSVPDKMDIPRAKPGVPVNYVLEVNAGFIQENNIKVGDTLQYKPKS